MLDTNTHYVYEVFRLKSVSAAANALFVSQPAICAAIRKVESELGAPIFNRKTLPFTLTPAGKIYMEAVEKQLAIEAQALERIQVAQHYSGGTLKIAGSSHIACRVIPKLLRVFHQKHPNVKAQLRIVEVEKVGELLEKNLADLVLTDIGDPLGYHSVQLFMQRCVVVVREDTSLPPELRKYGIDRDTLIYKGYSPEQLVTDNTLFQGVEFIHIPPFPYINRRRTSLLGKFTTAPHVTSATSRMQMNYNLMLSGFGALLTTDAHIAALPPDTGCLYFVLGNEGSLQPLSIIHPQNSQGTANLIRDHFTEIALAYFDTDNPLLKIMES